jgi:hypothetical protein
VLHAVCMSDAPKPNKPAPAGTPANSPTQPGRDKDGNGTKTPGHAPDQTTREGEKGKRAED